MERELSALLAACLAPACLARESGGLGPGRRAAPGARHVACTPAPMPAHPPALHPTPNPTHHIAAAPLPGVVVLKYAELQPFQIALLLVALNAYGNAPYGGKLLKVGWLRGQWHGWSGLLQV